MIFVLSSWLCKNSNFIANMQVFSLDSVWSFCSEQILWLIPLSVDNDFLEHDSWVEWLYGQGMVTLVMLPWNTYLTFYHSTRYGRIIDAIDVFRFFVQVTVHVHNYWLLVVKLYGEA